MDNHLPPWDPTVFLERMEACDMETDNLYKNHLRHALLACGVLVYTAEYVLSRSLVWYCKGDLGCHTAHHGTYSLNRSLNRSAFAARQYHFKGILLRKELNEMGENRKGRWKDKCDLIGARKSTFTVNSLPQGQAVDLSAIPPATNTYYDGPVEVSHPDPASSRPMVRFDRSSMR